MRVWILQTGEPLHCDGGTPRPMRAMNLANALVARGHEVVVWSTAFYHQEKRHRCNSFQSVRVSERLVVNLLPSPGYRRNVGFGRLFDHAMLAHNLSGILRRGEFENPDAAFVGFPPIETAAVMTRWLKARGVPLMLDAKDQWPEIFVEPLPPALRPLGRLVLKPYYHYAARAMRDADAFCAMSEEFIDWMVGFSGRRRSDADYAAPLTSPRLSFGAADLEAASGWCRGLGIDEGRKNVFSFFGSISKGFDFSVVRDLARRCLDERLDCRFVICGDGAAGEEVRNMMAGLDNVLMPGWIDAPKIAAISRCSLATLAPYINNDAFGRSVPNKIIDSLANGLPIISTLNGKVGGLIAEEGVGYCGQSVDEMYAFVKRLLNDEGFSAGLSGRSGAVYEKWFSYDRVYGGLVSAFEKMANHEK